MFESDTDAALAPQSPSDANSATVPSALEAEHRRFLVAYNALSSCLAIVSKDSDYVSKFDVRDMLRKAVEKAYWTGRAAFLEAHRDGMVTPTIDDESLRRSFCDAMSSDGPIGAYRLLDGCFSSGIKDKLLRDTVRTVISAFDLRRADAMKVRAGHVVLSHTMYLDHLSKSMGRVEYDYRCVERLHDAIIALLNLLSRVASPQVAGLLRGGVHGLARHSVAPEVISQLTKPPLKFRGYQGKVEISIPIDLANGLANLLSLNAEQADA